LTELAAFYHRDKLDYTLNQPREYVSGQDGVSREAFDYFPEYHYEKGFEQLRGTVSDDTVDDWMDEVIGHEPVAASHGGLWRDTIPQLVADIPESSHGYETEITINPESIPYSNDYVVEWKRVGFDQESGEWTPINELQDSEEGVTFGGVHCGARRRL